MQPSTSRSWFPPPQLKGPSTRDSGSNTLPSPEEESLAEAEEESELEQFLAQHLASYTIGPDALGWYLEDVDGQGTLHSYRVSWSQIARPHMIVPGFSVYQTTQAFARLLVLLPQSLRDIWLMPPVPVPFFSFIRYGSAMIGQVHWLYTVFGYEWAGQIQALQIFPNLEQRLLLFPKDQGFPW